MAKFRIRNIKETEACKYLPKKSVGGVGIVDKPLFFIALI